MKSLLEECSQACVDYYFYNQSDTYLDEVEQKVWDTGKAIYLDRCMIEQLRKKETNGKR